MTKRSTYWTPEGQRRRPSEVTPALADHILSRLENGESLGEICEDMDMPFPATVLGHALDDEEFGKRYRRAMHIQGLILEDRLVGGAVGGEDKNYRWVLERRNPQRWGSSARHGGVGGVRGGISDDGDDGQTRADHRNILRRKIGLIAARLREARSVPTG